MKYILAVGIIFQKYKKPMEVTIRSKKFIDSFEIEKDIGCKDHPEARFETTVGPGYYVARDRGDFPYLDIPKKFFFYEIDDGAVGGKILLSFDCEDNNYTNGFMTKTSMFKLRMISLIPKPFFAHYHKTKGQHRFFKRLQERSCRKVYKDPDSVWPYNRKNWAWSSADTKLDTEHLHIDRKPPWIGGKIQVEIPVIKKFGVKMFDPYSDRKYGFVLSNMFCYKSIFEKYYKLNMLNED